MRSIWMYLKQLLIPLCHSFILLPLCAIFAGAPGEHALIAFWGILMLFSLAGWLANMLIPQRINPQTISAGLLLLGLVCGLTFLPQLWCTLSGFGGRSWLGLVLGAAFGGVMVWTQQECHDGLAQGMPNYELGIGIILYISTYFVYRGDGRYTNWRGEDLYQPIYLFGAVWLLLAVVVMNYQHISRVAASKNRPRPPKNVLFFNVIFSLILAGGTLLVANFGQLRTAVTRLFLVIIKFLFPMVEEEPPEELEGIEIKPDERENELSVEWQLPPWVQIAFMAFFILIVLFVVGYIIRLALSLREEKKRPPRSKEYEEETESLLDWADVKEQLRRRMRRRTGTRFEDQPDGRSRVRWLYARLREELRRRERYNSTLTPTEQAKTQFPSQERAYQLMELYNKARYSKHAISEAEALEGKEMMDELNKNMDKKATDSQRKRRREKA